MSKHLDSLFAEGLTLGDTFLVKAQLIVPVRPASQPVAQEIIDGILGFVDTHYAEMEREIQAVLRTADVRKAVGLYVVDGARGASDLFKAALPKTKPAKTPAVNITGQPRAKPGQASARPAERKKMDTARAGTRGGKWYLDERGNVRYGTKPTHVNTRELAPEEVQKHLVHFRPIPFMGTHGADRDLVDYITKNAKKIGFTPDEAMFLDGWYGSRDAKTGEYSGGVVDQFLDEFGESMDTLEGDLTKPFSNPELTGGEPVSYQEAVLAFWRNQEWTGDDGEPLDFDEHILPQLDSLFKKFEAVKLNPALQQTMEKVGRQAIENRDQTLAFKITDTQDVLKDMGDVIQTEPDPIKQAHKIGTALAALNLVFVPSKEAGDYTGAHLKGIATPNALNLRDGTRQSPNFLLQNPHLLDQMSVSQLMVLGVAANLNSVWDTDTRTYDDPSGAAHSADLYSNKFPKSQIYAEVTRRLHSKMKLTDAQLAPFLDQIDKASSVMAGRLNDANSGKDAVFKEFIRQGTDIVHDAAKGDAINARFEDWANLRTDALEAMSNESITLPKTMKDGVFGPKGTRAHFRHQRQAINWMHAVKRGVLALSMGMGKTDTVITFMEQLKEQGKAKSAILFLPPSLMNQWPNEIANAVPGAKGKILNLSGLSLEDRKAALNSPMAKSAEYILISTGTLNGGGEQGDAHPADNDGSGGSDNEMVELLKGLDGAVFIDEVHQGGFKSADTVRSKIAKQVLGDREYAFGMTATPMPNHPMDLFNLIDTFAPGSVGTQDEWAGGLHGVQYNAMTDEWAVTNPEELAQLRTRTRPFLMHKLADDPEVLSDPVFAKMVPNKSVKRNVPIEINEDHPMYEYVRPGGKVDALVEARIDELEEINQKEYSPRARALMTKLLAVNLHRQANISPSLIDDKYDDTKRGNAPKLDAIVDDAVEHFKGQSGKEDSPLIIFSSFPGKAFPLLRRRLAAAGIDPSLVGEIHGGKGTTERSFEQDMTNAGKRKVLLVGTMSGGAGLNLQKAAHTTMFLDEPWHPSAKSQAQGRVTRVGQKRQTYEHNYRITFPWGESWDEKTQEKLQGKQAMVSAMLSDVDISSLKFSDEIQKQIDDLGVGGKKATKRTGGDGSAQRMAKLLKDSYGEEFGDVDEGSDDVKDIDESFDDSYRKHHDTAAQKKLAKDAPNIAGVLDEAGERRTWNQALRTRNAKNVWSLKQTQLQVATTEGDTKKQEAHARAARKVVENYRQWYGEQLAQHVSFGKKSGKANADASVAALKRAEQMRADFPEAFESQEWDSKLKDRDAFTGGKTSAKPAADVAAPALPKDQARLLKESKYESKKGEAVVGVRQDEASGRYIVKIKTSAGSREVSLPGTVTSAKDVLAGIDAKTSAKTPAKDVKPARAEGNKKTPVLTAATSPFAGKKEDKQEHHVWEVIHASGAKNLKQVQAALRAGINWKMFGVDPKKHDVDDAIKTLIAHMKKRKALTV